MKKIKNNLCTYEKPTSNDIFSEAATIAFSFLTTAGGHDFITSVPASVIRFFAQWVIAYFGHFL
jgi:hypothetical protein